MNRNKENRKKEIKKRRIRNRRVVRLNNKVKAAHRGESITRNVVFYKAFDENLKCKGMQYEVGKVYVTGVGGNELKICNKGALHFCKSVYDLQLYYNFSDYPEYRICVVKPHGIVKKKGNKYCTNVLEIVREIVGEEKYLLLHRGENNLNNINNLGMYNTGDFNEGCYNSGGYNEGDYNTGSNNLGSFNSGDWNRGKWNTGSNNRGKFNSGSFNKGDGNSGKNNSGSWNCGNYNDGDNNVGSGNNGRYNVGDNNEGCYNVGNMNEGYFNVGENNDGSRNVGNCNIGKGNIGSFNLSDNCFGYCNTENVKQVIYVFDKATTLSNEQVLASEWYKALYKLRTYKYEECNKNKKFNYITEVLSYSNIKAIKNMPNFNFDKFKLIFGWDMRTGRKINM